jgi:hypothetical protein
MSSRILVDPNLTAAKQLLEYVDAVADAVAKGRRLKAQLDSMSSGSDWHQVAIELGLPDPGAVSSTAAQDAWTIISTAQAAIDVPQVRELARLDQG